MTCICIPLGNGTFCSTMIQLLLIVVAVVVAEDDDDDDSTPAAQIVLDTIGKCSLFFL